MTELRIKERMEERGISAAQLSLMTLIEKSALSRLINGKQALKLEYLDAVAWALGCTVSDLFAGQPQPPKAMEDVLNPLVERELEKAQRRGRRGGNDPSVQQSGG